MEAMEPYNSWIVLTTSRLLRFLQVATCVMESECPTPYNSLNVPVKRDGVVCCIHGTSCEVAKKQREANGEFYTINFVVWTDFQYYLLTQTMKTYPSNM
ncbi:hypothetical protein KIN20_012335 [Parelaphostrongylus tenuis]|uniref:Uncharacterized protein n=1 Tax=Parelaphostrongylus tenuis TaxID=148309 RepID=A0AAD5MWM3_PARTN|nr:hypothetical protein KIN20_012335 [Parelaphostrongylus tenuis]